MYTLCDWCNKPIESSSDCREVDHHYFHKDKCEEAYREYCRGVRQREQERLDREKSG